MDNLWYITEQQEVNEIVKQLSEINQRISTKLNCIASTKGDVCGSISRAKLILGEHKNFCQRVQVLMEKQNGLEGIDD